MEKLAAFLTLIDWGAVVFVALVAAICMHLWRMDQDPTIKFRLVQFVCGPDGQANSGSLAYTGVFLVGVWMLFYREVHGRETDLLFGTVITGFVTGIIMRKRIDSKERIATGTSEPQG